MGCRWGGGERAETGDLTAAIESHNKEEEEEEINLEEEVNLLQEQVICNKHTSSLMTTIKWSDTLMCEEGDSLNDVEVKEVEEVEASTSGNDAVVVQVEFGEGLPT